MASESNTGLVKTLITLCEYHGFPFVEEMLDVIKVVYNEAKKRGAVAALGPESDQGTNEAGEKSRWLPKPSDIEGCEVLETPEFLAAWKTWVSSPERTRRSPGSRFLGFQLSKLAEVAKEKGIDDAVGFVGVSSRLGYSAIFFPIRRSRSHLEEIAPDTSAEPTGRPSS